MAEKVRFYKGTQAKYNALQDKKSNYIYVITDTPAIYLGTTCLTSGSDLSSAVQRIAAIEGALDGIDLTTEGSVRETIDDVLEYIEGIVGDLNDLETTADSSLVAAINENKTNIDAKSISISVAGTPTTGYLKTYVVSQGNTEVGKIDIPKDLVIQSGALVEATSQNPINGQISGTFLELTIANQAQKLYVNLSALIDVYTAQANATQVQLSITNGVISASIVAGSVGATELRSSAVETAKIKDKNVTSAKLEQSVQNILSSADSHVSSTSNPHSVTYSQVGAAAASHTHSTSDITSGTLSSSRGGTGQSSLQDAANSLIKSLSLGTNDPVDGDYIITQYAGGGSSTETYHRRSVTTLYNYMKSKLSSDFAALSHGNHVPTYSTSNNDKVLKVVSGALTWATDNNNTYTFEEGTTNGTIKVTPSGGSASNISVHGLGTAAYTNSSEYATSGHVHTLTLATDTGVSSVALEANTKYKLTAGGSTLIFTTPAHQSLTNYALSSHTHTLSIAEDSGTNQLTLAFGTKYKLTSGGNTFVFTMPTNPDTNTTYGFTGGTNKFTVTPSSGDAYDVTVTPSIANNITGTGTSGYIAKFNGTNTITNGPAFGSGTTFLRNDGQWATPTDTDTKVNVVARGTTKAYLLGTTSSPTSTASAQTAVAETGVYFDTTAATLVATTFKGSLTGTASGNLTSSSDLAWSKVTGTPSTLSGYGITDAASSTHTHNTTLATDTGDSSITLTSGGKYKLTAGGKSVIFTMPTSNNYSHPTYDTATAAAKKIGRDSTGHVVIGGNITASDVGAAESGHTHSVSLSEDTGTSTVTLTSAGKFKLTAGGSSVVFTMPTIPTVSYPVTSVNSKTGAVTLTYSDVSAASSSHTHLTTLAEDNGTSIVTLASGGKYKLTAGGNSVVFTMPTIPSISYPVTSVNSKTGAVTLTASDVGAAASGHTHTASDVGAATSGHTHTLTLATDSGDSSITLASGTKYKLTAGGKSLVFTMPTIPSVSYPVTSVNSKTGAVTLSASDVGAATSGHTHDITLVSGGTSTVDLAANTAYTLTAGGKSVIFKTPAHQSLSGYVPTSRTVNSKALSSNITLTASDVGAIASTLKGANSGVAELDSNGKVPSSQLPSFVDDVLEYSSQSNFPSSGETGKIYVDTTTNKTYRWSGTAYVAISSDLALGETSATAYRGDRGKTAYDHSQAAHARTDATKVEASSTNGHIKINGTDTTVYTHPSGTNPHGTTASDVGLGNVGNFKAVSTVASQGLSDTEKSNARDNIGAGTSSLTLGTSSTTAAKGDHTHTTTLASDTGTSTVTLASAGKYKLTAGGTSVIFTMPTIPTVSYPVTSVAGKTGAVTLSASDVGAATSGHTHSTTLAEDSGTSTVTLESAKKYKLTAGGNSVVFTMPTIPTVSYPVTSVAGKTGAVTLTASDVGAASSSHTHDITLATDTGTSSVALESAGKYKLTAGGKSVIFTMPTIPTVNYPVTSVNSKTGAVTLTASDVGAAASSHTHDYSASNHTHTTSIATSSGTNQLTLAFGTKYALTAGGTSYVFTMPSNPNTNTTYTLATGDANGQIKVTPSSGDAYNVDVKGLGSAAYTASTAYAGSGHTHDITLASDSGSSTVDLAANTVYKLTAGGKSVIFKTPADSNTWRGIQNNLTSDSTTDSLSAAQGKELKSLVDGKAASGHTHTLSIATDSGTNQLSMTANTKYKITAGGSTYIFTTPADTTYESKTAASGGTAVSLVTTGEKYTWNNKSDLTLGNTSTTAAYGNHTHTTTLASGGTSTVDLAANTTYTLTAGGTSVVFKTPAHQSLSGYSQTSHTHTCTIATDSGTNALTMEANTKYKLTAGGSTFIFTTPAHQSLSGYSTTSHTHTTTLTSDTGSSSVTLAYDGKYKLTAGGTSVVFTMPSAPSAGATIQLVRW